MMRVEVSDGVQWPKVRIILRADSGFANDCADGVVRGL
jgi:hypothetical protein